MQRPATWKIAAIGAALTGLSFIGAGTAVAATHTDVIPERFMALADEADATAGNDVEAMFTGGNDSDSQSTSSNDAGPRSTDKEDMMARTPPAATSHGINNGVE